MTTMWSGPWRWLRDTAIGYWRSVVLVAVAGLIPALTVAVAVFGLSFSRSWSAHLHAPLLVRLVTAIGEWALAALWTAVGFSVAMAVLGRPTAQFLRRYGGHWLGAEIASPYRPPRPIAKMSTGYWWNGHGFHDTERQAKIEAWFMDRSLVAMRSADGDPQLRRDVVWQVVAAATVVPVAALPLLAGAGAIYAATAQSVLWVALFAVASVATAPFAWRALSPVASRYLAPGPNATAEGRQPLPARDWPASPAGWRRSKDRSTQTARPAARPASA